MTKRYDLLSSRKMPDGKYANTRLGVMMPAKDGSDRWSIKLDAYPLQNDKGEVWITAFPAQSKDKDQPRTERASTKDEISDDIPF